MILHRSTLPKTHGNPRLSLLKIANLKRGLALHAGDNVSLKEADDLISLHSVKFTDRMASTAHASCSWFSEAFISSLRSVNQSLTNVNSMTATELCMADAVNVSIHLKKEMAG